MYSGFMTFSLYNKEMLSDHKKKFFSFKSEPDYLILGLELNTPVISH